MSGGVNTKFDPEKIAQTAENLYANQGKLASALDTIAQRTDYLKNHWKSDAADLYQARAEGYKNIGGELSAALLSLANRLQGISGIQRKAEKDTADVAEGLQIDGVN